MDDLKELQESLSPNERKILPYLEKANNIEEIIEKSKLEPAAVKRSLQFLENKNILKLKTKSKKIVDLGVNGILYKKNSLPERRLLTLIEQNALVSLQEAKSLSKLNDNEFKASLGALKRKAMIELKKSKIFLTAKKEEITKKSLEEQFIESLPLETDKLKPEQQHALNILKNRKDIIEIRDEKTTTIKLTEQGKELVKQDISGIDLIEELTPEIIKSNSWKNKKFRRYDIQSPVPFIRGGKRHFVNQAIDYARKIWTEMGFKEMRNEKIVSGFWNFDALFTAQDHPVRDLHDTFYIKDMKSDLPKQKLVKAVKKAHEKGVKGSKGWQYQWKEDDAKSTLLRTHTTVLSAKTLSMIAEKKKDLPQKFFIIGRNYRNETVDWSHGFEFYQTEGIVVNKNANFRHLLGYLKEFYKKMGFPEVRFTPGYFPYTEPSVETQVWHPKKKVWLELGGAGIFRPELTIPLLGEHIPVLAWGQGFDRTIMDYFDIKDLREIWKNDLNKLRKMKFWTKC